MVILPIFILCFVSVRMSSLIIFWTAAIAQAAYGQKEDEEVETSPFVSLDSKSKRIFITYETNFTDIKNKITSYSVPKSQGDGNNNVKYCKK